MKVKIFGPNLNDQSKGQFHVHKAECSDCMKYGPFTKLGGERDEMTIEAKSAHDCVEFVYSDQITEAMQDGRSREEIVDSWVSDLWFAPCTDGLPTSVEETVYECWMANQKDTFVKLSEPAQVLEWAAQQLNKFGVGSMLMVGIHSSSEYNNTDTEYANDSADGTMVQR